MDQTLTKRLERTGQVLAKYFALTEVFLYNEADEILRHKSTIALGNPCTLYLSPLLLLSANERIYFTLTYLDDRWIRKDHLDYMYAETLSDLNKAARAFRTLLSSPEQLDPKEHEELTGIQNLIYQTALLVGLRIEMVGFYRALTVYRGTGIYDDFILTISNIKKQVLLGLDHPLLNRLKSNVVTEISTLLLLLQAQKHIGNYNFRESIVCLFRAKSELDSWKQSYFELCKGKPTNSDSQRPLKSGVFNWLYLFLGALHSKMTLYYYNIFEKNEKQFGGMDMALVCSQLDINYYSLIQVFVNKAGCNSVCLMMDAASNPETRPTGAANVGYQCPEADAEVPQGLRSWPAIFSFPDSQPPLQHWPNLISLIIEQQAQLDKFKEPVHWYDDRSNATYFISKLDPRVYILVLFTRKKKRSDQLTQEFLYVMATHLRNWKAFARLKPVSK